MKIVFFFLIFSVNLPLIISSFVVKIIETIFRKKKNPKKYTNLFSTLLRPVIKYTNQHIYVYMQILIADFRSMTVAFQRVTGSYHLGPTLTQNTIANLQIKMNYIIHF